eukprot:TRINITY_DN2268_c0_g1_i1.p1 TRINITY_DN2268_c0_g1~~TRINITY_DN2268_c0_g1_i1.p1  ORF type:complete len:465 (+),score=93.87 TRINITY_DN2268_c0_g1_i1:49-1395(+)
MGCVSSKKGKKEKAEELNLSPPTYNINIEIAPLGDLPPFNITCCSSITTRELKMEIQIKHQLAAGFHLVYEGATISEHGAIRNATLQDIGIKEEASLQLVSHVIEPEVQCICVRESESCLPIISDCNEIIKSSFCCASIAVIDDWIGVGLTKGKFKIYSISTNELLYEDLTHKGIVEVVRHPGKKIFYTTSEFDTIIQTHTATAADGGFVTRVLDIPYRTAVLMVPFDDSEIIICGDYYDSHKDTSIRLHRLSDGRLVERIVVSSFDGMITCFCVSADKKTIYSCSWYKIGNINTVDILAHTYEEVDSNIKFESKFKMQKAHHLACNTLIEIPANRLLSSASDGTVKLWNTLDQSCLFDLHDDFIDGKKPFTTTSVAYLNPFIFFTGKNRNNNRDHDLTDIYQYVLTSDDTYEKKRQLKASRHSIRSLKVINQTLVSCAEDGNIRFWD